jgi:hyperosmotically inducible periplasmic protein
MQKAARHTLRAVVAATAAIVVLGACSRDERKEVRTEVKQATNTAANAVDNAALTTKVKAALLADELVKGTQINVDSNNGVVTLTGAVDSPAHMQKAEQIAKGVSGVTRVQNNLNAPTTTTTSSTPPSSTMASSPATPPSSMTADKKDAVTTKP